MVSLSVLVPARDRTAHLANLVDGLNRAADAPRFELVVGRMGGEDPGPALDRARGFPASAIEIDGEELPLASARNGLAEAASAQCASLPYTGPDNCHPVEVRDGRALVATS